MLDDCDLSGADLKDLAWQHIKSLKRANISGVRNAPDGFITWAMSNGAVNQPETDQLMHRDG